MSCHPIILVSAVDQVLQDCAVYHRYSGPADRSRKLESVNLSHNIVPRKKIMTGKLLGYLPVVILVLPRNANNFMNKRSSLFTKFRDQRNAVIFRRSTESPVSSASATRLVGFTPTT